MKELIKGYRIIYLWVLGIIILLIIFSYYFQIQNGDSKRVLNSIGIIGSALTLFGLVITIVEIYGINSISKLTKEAADRAVNDVLKNTRLIKLNELKNHIELLKTNLIKEENGVAWTHLKEIINVLDSTLDKADKENPESDSNIILDKLERWRTIFEEKLSAKTKFDKSTISQILDTLNKIKTNSKA